MSWINRLDSSNWKLEYWVWIFSRILKIGARLALGLCNSEQAPFSKPGEWCRIHEWESLALSKPLDNPYFQYSGISKELDMTEHLTTRSHTQSWPHMYSRNCSLLLLSESLQKNTLYLLVWFAYTVYISKREWYLQVSGIKSICQSEGDYLSQSLSPWLTPEIGS